jgi:hypothetical protein
MPDGRFSNVAARSWPAWPRMTPRNPETAIVRIALDDRNALLEDAPDTYYVTLHWPSRDVGPTIFQQPSAHDFGRSSAPAHSTKSSAS